MIHLIFTFLCESDNLKYPKCFTDYETISLQKKHIKTKTKFNFVWCSDYTVGKCDSKPVNGCEITYMNGEAEEVFVSNRSCGEIR